MSIETDKEKQDVAYVEKAYDAPSKPGEEAHPEQNWTPEEEKAVVKKADWRVFPMLCFLFGLSLLDRTNVSAAYIAGLKEDLNLGIENRYNIALLVFFIGYGLFEFPSNYFIRRVGARIWLSSLIVIWGACVLGIGFAKNWKVLAGLRALLGIFEAGLFPGGIYIIGSWYRQYETARRMAIFYMASLITSGFGPIFAYALSLIHVGDGMFRRGWRWIFIIEGTVTILAGLVAPLFLIEFPEKVTFLTDRQKHIAVTRVSLEKKSAQTEHATVKELLRMLLDWKLAVYALMYFLVASSVYALQFFQPLILRDGMGFSYVKAQLLSSPTYLFAVVASLLTSWISDKIRMRWPVLVGQAVVATIGLLIILYAKPPGVRYFGLFLASWGTQGNVPASLSYGQNQTAKVQKRAVVAAATISLGAAGGVVGSSIFQAKDAPQYLPGMWTAIAFQILLVIITICMSMHFKWLNRLADKGKRPSLEGVEGFRYAP